MGKRIITFGKIEIEKHKFYHYKNSTFLKDVDIDNLLISNKISSSKKNYKNFIGYIDSDYESKLFSIILSKTRAYLKSYGN